MSTVEAVPAAQPQLPPPLPQPPPRRRGPANATVAMVLAGLLLFVATYLLLRDREATYRVAVTATELRPGTVLGPGAFAIVDIKVDETVLDELVTAERLLELEGWVAVNSLAVGELVAPGDLRAPAAPSDLRAMSLPVKPERAVAGDLEIGDRVDVIATVGGLPSYVAADLEVIAVSGSGEVGALQAATAPALTIAVNPEQGLALAQALTNGELDVLRSTGAQVVDLPSASATAAAPAGAADPAASPDPAAGPDPSPQPSAGTSAGPRPGSGPSPGGTAGG